MYLLFGIFLAVCAVFTCLQFYRKGCIIRKLSKMNLCRKVCLLNELLEPFGFCYQTGQDVIVTSLEAWQRQFGYCSRFDRTALHFGMVFDCEPFFFYYRGRTYRIELWKGQYGINLGGEVGIYYAEGRVSPDKFDTTHFESIPDDELLIIEMALYQSGQKLFESTRPHWWLGGFCMGKYSEPENLTMQISITFTSQQMLCAFVESMLNNGYRKCDITVCDLMVSFCFSCPHTMQPRVRHCLCAAFSCWKDRLYCRLFLWMTRPFCCTLDRILYLYFYLPAAFRHMFLCRKNRGQKLHRKKKVVHLGGL